MEPAASKVKGWSYCKHPDGMFAIYFNGDVKFFVSLESEAIEYVNALRTKRKTVPGSVGEFLALGEHVGNKSFVSRFEASIAKREQRKKEKSK